MMDVRAGNEPASWIDEVCRSGTRLPSRPLLERLQASDGELTTQETYQLVKLAAHQLGRWLAEYDFSPATAPDMDAARESGLWVYFWRSVVDALCRKVPEIQRQDLARERDLIIARHALRTRLMLSDRHSAVIAWWGGVSRFAIVCHEVGLVQIAQALYGAALYPANAAGRARGSLDDLLG